MKKMVLVISILSFVFLSILYIHIISGGIPFIEYWYNTQYSEKYEKSKFDTIESGASVDLLFKLIGSPLIIRSYTTKDNSEIEVYYYSCWNQV